MGLFSGFVLFSLLIVTLLQPLSASKSANADVEPETQQDVNIAQVSNLRQVDASAEHGNIHWPTFNLFSLDVSSFFTRRVTSLPLKVTTEQGTLKGFKNAAGVRVWRSVRYAAPPIGKLRFADPKPAVPFSGVIVADEVSPACIQSGDPFTTYGGFGMSEDCLFLQIYAPATKKSDEYPNGFPVFFWIHGGSFTSGQGNLDTFDGSVLAKKNLVVVAINYRLGFLGFFKSASMTGNYGFKDQVMALNWVQQNIAAFGGNPNLVTIAGESAGAISVQCHLTSPLSEGLFHRAIMESAPTFTLQLSTVREANYAAAQAYAASPCDFEDIACLRTLTLAEIVDFTALWNNAPSVHPKISYLPTVGPIGFPVVDPDGGVLPRQIADAFRRGKIHAVPMIMGTVEVDGFVVTSSVSTMKTLDYQLYLIAYMKESPPTAADFPIAQRAKKIYNEYPCELPDCDEDAYGAWLQYTQLWTDLAFFCPLRQNVRAVQEVLGKLSVPVYRYVFQQVNSFDCYASLLGTPNGLTTLSAHGIDTVYTFGSFSCMDYSGTNESWTPTAHERHLTQRITSAFSNFAHTADPNEGPFKASLGRAWPQYHPTQDSAILLKEPDSAKNSAKKYRGDFCDFWDTIGYSFSR